MYGHVLPSFINHVMHSWQYGASLAAPPHRHVFLMALINHVERLAKTTVSWMRAYWLFELWTESVLSGNGVSNIVLL